jgi:hypothetical protein
MKYEIMKERMNSVFNFEADELLKLIQFTNKENSFYPLKYLFRQIKKAELTLNSLKTQFEFVLIEGIS